MITSISAVRSCIVNASYMYALHFRGIDFFQNLSTFDIQIKLYDKIYLIIHSILAVKTMEEST